MTLVFRRRAIARAVQGELSAEDDAALLLHLRGCASCRGHYDALVTAQRALEGTGVSKVELTREKRRLEAALTPPAVARPNARWLGVPALGLAVAAVLFVVVPRAPLVTERGADDGPAPFSVSVYAKPKSGDGKTRLAAELPASGEARVSVAEWVQLKTAPDVVVVLVRDGQAPTAVDLRESAALATGEYRLFAVRGAPLPDVLRAAATATRSTRRLELAKPQVTGVLFVEP